MNLVKRWDAWTEMSQEWVPVVSAQDYDALSARMAEAHRLLKDIYLWGGTQSADNVARLDKWFDND